MGYADIRDAIETQLNTVANVGIVNDYRRALTTYTAFEQAFTTTIAGQQQIRAWTIAWESGGYEPMGWTDSGQRMRGPQTFVVRGYMSSNDGDASDKTFSALIRAVIVALTTVGATLTPKQAWIPVELRTNGYLNFEVPGVGTVLVHHCEIAFTVDDEEIVS